MTSSVCVFARECSGVGGVGGGVCVLGGWWRAEKHVFAASGAPPIIKAFFSSKNKGV